ncbi:MAG: DNA topoisomerase 3 [Desulfobacterales bacterium]|nr:DNA topoisomerase 3 [Desulfobacterales bacterium]MDD4071865.1 DNA topoisomerase 3 [Desulfobacterales bacterium]MDD4391526.1 DNA topoisomerase 3 [Desulfobacterales bacterium]
MTDLILTEKFSVASDFAKALGVKKKGAGYFDGDTYVITWAVGHLVELFEPDDYDASLKKWRVESLPLIPDRFRYKPIKKSYQQFHTIKTLLNKRRFDRIIIATDAGREGEVIARTILLESGFTDKARIVRFWTSQALVPEVVRNTMKQLRPMVDFDRLWRAGYYRQVADWLVGMNLTRVLTVRLRDLFSVGRVQTAVLALLVDRRREREHFVPETYWTLKVLFGGDKGRWTGRWFKNKETKLTEKKAADELLERLKNEISPGVVLTMETDKKSEPPPLLFSLTDLQQEANNRFGFSAKKTLAIAQTLYQDRKCLSYPRTDSKVLGTTSLDLVNTVLEKLKTACSDIFSTVDPKRVALSNRRVFNDAKLTDHHALIPFKPLSEAASQDEKRLFDLVVRRFAAAFHPDCQFENTRVITEFANETFQTVGKVILDPGWRRVYRTDTRDKAEAEVIPPLVKGDSGAAKKIDCEEKQTTPPPDYSDSLLLKDMTNPGRYVAQEEIKRFYRGDIGIGTQSTRAQIIETLIQRAYAQRIGKRLVATDKGVYLVTRLRQCPISSVLASPEETARWEMSLNTIALGETLDTRFLDDIKRFVTDAVAELKSDVMDVTQFKAERPEAEVIGVCPACGKAVRENIRAFSCEDRACEFVIFKKIAGKSISAKMAANLLKYRKSGPFKGFISKKKKRFSASLVINNLDGKWKVAFDFNNPAKSSAADKPTAPKTRSDVSPAARSGVEPVTVLEPKVATSLSGEMRCPLCGGTIIEGRRGFGCANWRPEHGDCHFVIWKEIAGKRLTLKNVEILVSGKKTRPYTLRDDTGVKFMASLRMVETVSHGFAIEVEPKNTDGSRQGFQISCSR